MIAQAILEKFKEINGIHLSAIGQKLIKKKDSS